MRRRAFLLAPLLSAAVLAADAHAAPVGAPQTLRTAVATDLDPRPGALLEWWRLTVVDPRSGRWLELQQRATLGQDYTGSLLVTGPDGELRDVEFGAGYPRATPGGLVADAGGQLRVVRRGGAVHVELVDDGVELRLRLRGARRGPAAFGWRVPSREAPPGIGTASWNWAVPFTAARTSGSLVLAGGTHIPLDGMRTSLEHGWGSLDFESGAWNQWSQYVLHDRDGAAWFLYGLNRSDTTTAVGARDAQWLGVLARVGARGVRSCRPRIRRSRWSLDVNRRSVAGRIRARCDGLRLTATDGEGLGAGDWHYIFVRRPTRAPGLRGVAFHLAQRGFEL